MNKIILFLLLLLVIILLYCKCKQKDFFNTNKKLFFLHIPKNAGTSIENLGNKYGIKWGRFVDKKNYKLYDTPCNYYYWHSPYFIKIPGYNYFAIIRNPYDKIISEFYYVGGYNDKHFKAKSHLESFYLWLDDKYNIIKKNKHWNNCHILPQYNYIYDNNGNKRVEHIIYMNKDFTKNLDLLFKKYNLNININDFEKNNSREKHFKKTELNNKAIKQINEMYKKDFKYFNFTKLKYGIENFINNNDLDYYEDFNNNKRLTLVFGYWEIKENSKHNIEHYVKNIKNTFSLLKNYDIIFFYNNSKYVDIINNVLDNSNNIKFIYRDIEGLPAYKYSNKLLKLCKNQNNISLNKINKLNEKGLVHYNRELKNGDGNYKKIMTIWFSKLYLIKECIEQNYYDNDNIAWCDISITKLPNKILKTTDFYALDNTKNNIIIFNNLMKYKGSQLIIGAAYIQSNKNKFMEFINKYIYEFEKLNENYCHDEETIMNLVYNKNKDDFIVLKAWN
jgi:hypothetical protein